MLLNISVTLNQLTYFSSDENENYYKKIQADPVNINAFVQRFNCFGAEKTTPSSGKEQGLFPTFSRD